MVSLEGRKEKCVKDRVHENSLTSLYKEVRPSVEKHRKEVGCLRYKARDYQN